MKKIILSLALCCICISGRAIEAQDATIKNRVIILTDVENEPDDAESLVRLMLYTNEIDVKGIIATTSTHMRNRVAPETIHKIVTAYGKVRDNLLLHKSGYPSEEYLHSIIKTGPKVYGMMALKEKKTSEGAAWIMKELQENDNRPLWICAWGGINTLAQALQQLKQTLPAKKLDQAIAKLRIYTISDQDDTGIWIRKNYPHLFYIVSPGGYGNATWAGIMATAPGADNEKVSNKWLRENIQQGHGPLGACYPDVAYGMEGDTPSWLNLIPNGLSYPEHPNWGGWGGRYEYYKPKREDCDLNGFNGGVPIEEEPHAIWTNAIDTFHPTVAREAGCAIGEDSLTIKGYQPTVWRWRTEMQNDFAARMAWCTKSYKDANHAPIAKLDHPNEMKVKAGSTFLLSAESCTDPDGDNLSYQWIYYPEAGTYKKDVKMQGSKNIHHIYVEAPEVKKKDTLHFILKVTDKGTPALSSYQRIIVTVEP